MEMNLNTIFCEENLWQSQTENRCIGYLPGRGIVEDAGGSLYFFPLSDLSFFSYGEMIDRQLLSPVSLLQPHELELLKRLRALNEQVKRLSLRVVQLLPGDEGEQAVFLSGNLPDCCFSMSSSGLAALTENQVEQLLTYAQERSPDNPCLVQMDDTEIIAY